MSTTTSILCIATVCLFGSMNLLIADDDLEEIKIKIPSAMFIGRGPQVLQPNLETPDPSKVIKSFLAPKGTVNVAQGKKVTSSDTAPVLGELALITDSDGDGSDGSYVELTSGSQWIQIDLEAPHVIQKVALWHYHKMAKAYIDVVIQASNDTTFKTSVTLFNNDHDNSSGLGYGKDPAYIETNHGRVIDGKSTLARYVRFWSNGNNDDALNHYCEAQVFAVPASR